MSGQEFYLKRAKGPYHPVTIYQDWFLVGSPNSCMQNLLDEDSSPEKIKTILLQVQEFVHSASRSGYEAGLHSCQSLFNTCSAKTPGRIRIADTFPKLQSPLKYQLRSHTPEDSILFDETTCDAALKAFTQLKPLTQLCFSGPMRMHRRRSTTRTSMPIHAETIIRNNHHGRSLTGLSAPR